jgi:cyclic lactone autoinducer peptide
MKFKIAAVLASILTFAAMVVSSSACWFYVYQPKEPKALRR